MGIATETVSSTKPAEVIERARRAGVQVVDVRFVDLPGTWQHFSLPIGELDESSFEEGLGFDGSSIRGFQAINESDMLLLPDPETATIDPCLRIPTLFLICDIIDPITREPYSRDARYVARKAEEYLRKTGIADVSYFGPEAEFYIFNSLRFDQNMFSGYYYIDSEEGIWNSGLGMKVATYPFWAATFLMMYLYFIILSPIAVRVSKRMSISAWPAVPTSWCWTSTGTPASISFSIISERRSCNRSVGGTGK